MENLDFSKLDVNNADDLKLIVEHMNTELSNGRTQKDIEINDFNVNARVMGKRLARKGFKKIGNKFVFIKDNKSNSEVTSSNIVIREPNELRWSNENDIKAIKELIDLLEPIKKLLKENNESGTIVTIEKPELKPKAVINIKQKNFKVDVDVLEKWENFVETHKEYKVQQLISLALEEFINKYK